MLRASTGQHAHTHSLTHSHTHSLTHRKPGQRSIIKNMVADIDKGQFECEDYGDIHTIGSLLKKFFQDLQDPLIPSEWVWPVARGCGQLPVA